MVENKEGVLSNTPIMPFDTDAYLADTTQLTNGGHGAYLRILIAMWRSDNGCIQSDRRLLATIAKVTLDKWTRYLEAQIMPLLTVIEPRGGDDLDRSTTREARVGPDVGGGGWISQKRLLQERRKLGLKARIPCKDSLQEFLVDSDSKFSKDSVIRKETDSQESKKKKEDSESQRPLLTLTAIDEESLEGRRRRCRLPKTWTLPASWQLWARQQGLHDADIATYADGFSNHYWATGNTMLDWCAAWRKWVGNEIKWAVRRQQNKRGYSRDPERPGGLLRIAARLNEVGGNNNDLSDETWWKQWATELTSTTMEQQEQNHDDRNGSGRQDHRRDPPLREVPRRRPGSN